MRCEHTFHRDCMIETCKFSPVSCKCPKCRRVLTIFDFADLGLLPKLTTIAQFQQYINYKLKDHTTTPLVKLREELDSFLGTDKLPLELLGNVALEFDIVTRLSNQTLKRYRLERILYLDLEDLPSHNQLETKKYFRFISIWDPEQYKIIAYQVDEV